MAEETQAPIMVRVMTVDAGLAVVLPRELLAEQGIGEGLELFVSVQSERIVLSRRSPSDLLQLDAAREGMTRYRNTLAELAK